MRKCVLRNFAKFIGKHLCQSLYFNKVAAFFNKACNFIKIETLTQVFSYEFCEIFKNTVIMEHVWATASVMFLKGFLFLWYPGILYKTQFLLGG